MDPKIQKIAMVVLGGVCAGIWVPQMLSGSTSSQVDLGDGDAEYEVLDGPDIGDGLPDDGTDSQAAVAWTGDAEAALDVGGDPRDGMASLVERLSVFGADGPRTLDDLAASWDARARESAPPAVTAQPFSAGSASTTEASAADPLAGFLAENPFQGTIVLDGDALAMFGPHALRVGDDILDGEAVVAEVTRKRVTISYRGLPLELALPPLRAQGGGRAAGMGAAPDAADSAEHVDAIDAADEAGAGPDATEEN